MKRTLFTLATVCLMSPIGSVSADEQRPPRPSREAVEAAATTMGVTGPDMKECAEARNGGKRPEGRPTKEQRKAMAEEMFTCLKAKNAHLDRETFDDAMRTLRPKRN